ncbi:ABC transporter substrate-binding protein [Pigmentiphaga aceris]|uniref:ABC transporter substrate-binding protein n=2 Tax=Pigmentiphaga aceris TaxID=1940612 RepID=A0A5C0B3B4_9BURK|nr:ABC transporter substrate-binding protein [Pigmentiphaga aceris]QEI08755.1 ABC transporter substrate-binding protein [Pigmentiphaga aceris]
MHRLSRLKLSTTFMALALSAGLHTTAQAADPQCELDRPVRFGGMNWESNLTLVGIERFILEKGYGCKTVVESGETLPMLTALQRGDVDVNSEIWVNMMGDVWQKALADGKVKAVGQVFTGREGWYIPRYTAERYPELKKATDLGRFKDKFVDPEDPAKGRLYGCPVGWVCGTSSENLMKALKLDQDYVMYAPGNSAAQKAAITSAYKRKKDIVFYYWTPTPLMGALDLVKLEMPPLDEKAYACLVDPECASPTPTDYKPNPIVTGLNTQFTQQAPALTAFFTKVSIPDAAINDTLGWLDRENAELADVPKYFLKTHGAVWKTWVPADVAQRVEAAL